MSVFAWAMIQSLVTMCTTMPLPSVMSIYDPSGSHHINCVILLTFGISSLNSGLTLNSPISLEGAVRNTPGQTGLMGRDRLDLCHLYRKSVSNIQNCECCKLISKSFECKHHTVANKPNEEIFSPGTPLFLSSSVCISVPACSSLSSSLPSFQSKLNRTGFFALMQILLVLGKNFLFQVMNPQLRSVVSRSHLCI